MKLRIAVDECLKRGRVSPASSGAKRITDDQSAKTKAVSAFSVHQFIYSVESVSISHPNLSGLSQTQHTVEKSLRYASKLRITIFLHSASSVSCTSTDPPCKVPRRQGAHPLA